MNCPKCKASMEPVRFESIQVQRCTNCKGLWFDMLEEEDLRKLKGSESIDVGDPKFGKQFNKISKINCPVENEPMIRMVDAQHHHIWYETCPECYGVFFDAGEFK